MKPFSGLHHQTSWLVASNITWGHSLTSLDPVFFSSKTKGLNSKLPKVPLVQHLIIHGSEKYLCIFFGYQVQIG